MTEKQKFQKPKGTRDFYPEEKRARHVLFDRFRALAMRWGYGEIETPAFEELELLTAKSGEAIKQEIFVLEQRGAEKFGLRFDLTVPAARLFIGRQKELAKPVKWFYVDKMWRYENPQKGRLREFYQVGVELFGSDKPAADAEVIGLAVQFLEELGLKQGQFIVKLNNRKLLEGLVKGLKLKDVSAVIRLIDKRKKMTEKEFEGGLKEAGCTKKQIEYVKEMLVVSEPEKLRKLAFFTKEAEEGLWEVESVLEALELFEKRQYVEFDLSTARGLEYYTGCVFECFDAKESLRSIFGGGRYDKLIRNFGGEPTPATGWAMGDATLQLLLEENGLLQPSLQEIDYYIIVIGEEAKEKAYELCQLLRTKYSVDIDLSGRSIKNQIEYASKVGAAKVVFVGGDEVKSGKATVKDLRTGKEERVEFGKLM